MVNLTYKNILITGGCGFIGSHLTELLIKNRANVFVFDKHLKSKSYFAHKNLAKNAVLIKGDIVKQKELFNAIKKNKIDYIFHLAAITIVEEAYKKPLKTFQTNIIGTVNVLESARMLGVKGVIVASSDKAYGKTNKAYKENSPLHGDHPYDVSKSSADLITQTYYKTYNFPVVVTRFGNIYGEGDLHFNRIIPGICEAVMKGNELLIRSNGKYIRDYIYVKDVAKGYVTLLKKFHSIQGEAFNFSSKDTVSVLDLIKRGEKILNKKIKYKILHTAKNEIPYQHLDDAKVRKLGWKSTYTLENSLRHVFAWYKKYYFSLK